MYTLLGNAWAVTAATAFRTLDHNEERGLEKKKRGSYRVMKGGGTAAGPDYGVFAKH